MTGMDIARKLQFSEETLEAMYRTQPLDIVPDPDDPQRTLQEIEPFAEQDNGLRILRFYLDWAVMLKEQYDALGIPEQVYWDGLKDLAIWAEDYREKHGVPGFAEWGWVATTLTMKVFRLGRLQFEPTQLEQDMVFGDRFCPAGTAILNVHIPAGEPLDVSAVREALEYASLFFRNLYQKTYPYFYCHSWLLSPKLKALLPEDSRILQFQNLFTAYEADSERQAEERVFGFLADDPAVYPEHSSLQRKMKAALLAGQTFGMGCGIREIPEH